MKDAVAAAKEEQGYLLTAADRHNGREASEEAVKSVLRQLG
jgi:hypothetical protein